METPTCKACQKSFVIDDEDFSFYKKFAVPPPTHCPLCRLRRRLAFRNERNLYHRTCDLCKKNIISIYSTDKPFIVYCQECWWSDGWDPLAFGQDFDFSKSFFEQFDELQKKVPRLALMNRNAENSEYCNYAGYNKNCYLAVGGSWYNEDCLYGRRFAYSRSSADCLSLTKGELCYETVWSANTYSCVYCIACFTSSNCAFSIDLRGCSNCILSSNLRNKNYYVKNKPVTKEQFEKIAAQLKSYDAFSKMVAEFHTLTRKAIHSAVHQMNCIDSTGDYLQDCKNVKDAYDVIGGEDSRYVFQAEGVKDVMDVTSCGYDKPELYYETVNTGNAGYDVKFCFSCWGNSNIAYCDTVMNSRNFFGCANMNRKQYCILNKQYSREEYEKLSAKIIEHMKKEGAWGEFFPISLSPFDYDETIAQDFFPLAKTHAPEKEYKKQTYQIPDHINDVQDAITNEILSCEATCQKNYRVIAQELTLYRKIGVPVPRKCPTCRHLSRTALRNPPQLFKSKCAKCGSEIQTSYAPDRPEIVYCEKCYLAVIY